MPTAERRLREARRDALREVANEMRRHLAFASMVGVTERVNGAGRTIEAFSRPPTDWPTCECGAPLTAVPWQRGSIVSGGVIPQFTCFLCEPDTMAVYAARYAEVASGPQSDRRDDDARAD